MLTNGAAWRAYRIRFEQPVSHDLVFELDLLDPDCKTSDLIRTLYLISREAVGGEAIDRYWRQKEATNRFVVAQLLLSLPLLTALRRELRRLAPGIRVTEETLGELLQLEVLKRDVLEGDKADAAGKRVRRATRKRKRDRAAETEEEESANPAIAVALVPVAATVAAY